MPRVSVSAILCLCATVACAQPARGNDPTGELLIVREQRRSELRDALQRSRTVEPRTAAGAATSVGRHLSPRELAEMREQLRRQQTESQRAQK